MTWKKLFALCLALAFFAGCDTGAPSDEQGNITPGGGEEEGNTGITACVLIGVQGDFRVAGDESRVNELCVGDVISLVGFNFPDLLEDIRVTFTTGNSSIEGLPLEVRNRRLDATSRTIDSTLVVLVPTGVSTGIIELFCGGVSAGAVGFDSCPIVQAATLGANGDQTHLFYFPNVGFQDGGSRVTIYGLNLSDVQEVLLDDKEGQTARIPASTFIRNTGIGLQAGQIPTGYESFSFNLNDTQNDIQFPYNGARENLGMRVRSPAGVSNRVEVAVSTDQAVTNELGAVINGVRAPTGIATGPVRIDYTCYEIIVDASWTMEFEWCVENCDEIVGADGGWFSAKPLDTDPLHHGKFEITCGPIRQGLDGGGTARRLLPGGGALRTFVWDAQCDPNFRALNDGIADGASMPRNWTVQLRVRPVHESGERPTFINHEWRAPPFVYFDLEDRDAEELAELRSAEFTEDFGDDSGEDFQETNALWGPPDNPGFLEGDVEATDLAQFGVGEAVVIFENQDLSDLPEQDTILGQFYLLNTDRMSITHNVLRDVSQPGNPPAIIPEASNYLLTDDGTPEGNRVLNPGSDINEFHIAYLEIAENTLVFVEGDNPLIVRIRGLSEQASDQDVGVLIDGTLNVSGGDGADGSLLAGGGGLAVAGGGPGGDGAFMQLQNPISGAVRILIEAEPGFNDGGDGGQTPAAIDPDVAINTSRIAGTGGGGGGHRLEGGDGDLGRVTAFPNEFVVPLVGRGGPPRGDFTQILLTGGSGGGGGGASMSKITDATGITFAATGGGGGGAGGGIVKITVKGTIVVNGTIEANGGNGGSGVTPAPNQNGFPPAGTERGAPGGGGSGGAIVVQASGPIRLASCESLRTNGGSGGTGGSSNGQSGGRGAPGFIRIESSSGGAPVCSALIAADELSANLSSGSRANTIQLVSAALFPTKGLVRIDDEFISYEEKEGNNLVELSRALRGSARVAHTAGTPVMLIGSISPADEPAVLLNGGLVEAPDQLDFGLGRDGLLHLRFVQSPDPETGGPLIDEGTGRPTSIWTFDTDSSTLTAPTGEAILRARHRETRPGFLDLLGLKVDEDVVLRGVGSFPLDISVRDRAEIAGTIDVSGSDGGVLRFTEAGIHPLGGLGGAPGAGGGRGGSGGDIEFLDGDETNRAAQNTAPVDGAAGGLPRALALINSVNVNGQLGVDPVRAATGGVSLHGQTCGANCLDTAGGGGGAGHLGAGADGQVVQLAPDGQEEIIGRGGSAIGFDDYRFGGDVLLFGGMGGGGGGAHPHVSSAFASGGIPGDFPFRGLAQFAPGTGGGGGGGVVRIAAANLHLRRGARLLARGGDAFQSIDLGGNGGAGAGGSIFLQVANSFTADEGIFFDLSGGKANRLPLLGGGDDRFAYEGNVRVSSEGSPPEETGTAFGGLGGDGAHGRIRIEAAAGSGIAARGVNPDVTAGPLLRDVVRSVGVSEVFHTGVGFGGAATSHGVISQAARIKFNSFQQPTGTDVVVLWEGAPASQDVHGAAGNLSGLVRDPQRLRHTDYIRFRAYFLSSFVNRQSQSISEVTVPLSLPTSPCLPFFGLEQ